MKKLFLLSLILLVNGLNGQIVVGDEVLPKVADTIWMLEDNMPNIRLGNGGQDQYWDFSSLSSGMGMKTVLKKQDQEVIPSALDYDFIVKEEAGVIRFYKQFDKSLKEVALQLPHPLNSNQVILSVYEKPKLIRYSNIKYGDDQTAISLIYHTLSAGQIPNLVKKKLPITADSIRIKVEEIQDFRVDAWGTLLLSYERFEVLRQDVNVRKITSIEVFSAGKWSKINERIIDPNNELLGETSQRHFYYFSNDPDELIAQVKIGNTGRALSASFRGSDNMTNVVNIKAGQQAIILSPNPSFGDVKLEILNADFGKYKFEIFNVIGKRLWEDELLVNRKLNSYKFDFSSLGKGTYLWALTNSQGIRVTTKRMVIITP